MRNGPLPLIGQFYSDDARPWSMQDVCNYLPAAAETEGTRTATKCTTPPGLAPFVETGSLSAVRGLYNTNGRLFGVIGPTFYEFSAEGVAIPRGTVGGASRVRMAHNQLTHGNEVIVVNGSSGYLYNTQTQVFSAISDDGYPGAIDVVFIDGYFVQIEPARRFAFNSDLAAGADYNTLDRFTSEVSPDPLVGLAAPQNELILFSETSAEFFANEGTAQQPFRSKRISMKRGAASRYGQAELDNTVFWLGNDGKFYVLEGYSPKRISTRPIEQAIRGLNWAQAFAFVWESEGHAVVYWTFPDGRTWGYDASQGRWHRRASYGLDRWRVNATAYWEDRWIAGDFQRGRLWELDWGYPWEYQTEFVSEIVAPVVHDNQNRVLMPRLEVLMDVGQPEVAVREFAVQPTGPTIEPMPEGAPVGVVGEPYNSPIGYEWTITPGTAPVTAVTLREGVLPAGLTMAAADGNITGTPTEPGQFPITVRATDSNGLFDEAEDTLPIYYSMWIATDNVLTLQKSRDGGETFPDDITTGLVTPTSEVAVWSTGGVLFQFGNGTQCRVSSDNGFNWTDGSSGLPSGLGAAVPGKVGAEWQIYAAGSQYVSSDATGPWVERAPASGFTNSPCRIGTTILATDSGNGLNVSTDAGVTFTLFTDAQFSNISRVFATADHFFAIGVDGSSNLRIRRSSTGLSGSFTTLTPPDTANYYGITRNPNTGRMLLTLIGGASYYSDDEGDTWTAGAAVPNGGSLTGGGPLNKTVYGNDAFFVCGTQGGGVNNVYRSVDGVAAFATVYTVSGGNAIQSLCEHRP